MGHDDNATCITDELDAFCRRVTEAVAIAQGSLAKIAFKGLCEVFHEAPLDKRLSEVHAADEFVASVLRDLAIGEVNAIFLKGGEHRLVARISSAEHLFKGCTQGGVCVVKAESYEMELATGDLGREFDARHALHSKAPSFSEEFIQSLRAIVVCEGHDLKPSSLTRASKFGGGEATIAGSRVRV